MSDPRPWLESGGPDGMKSLLESARADEPSAAQLARVMAKLGPLLIPSTAAAAASASSAAAPAAAPAATVAKAAVVKAGLATKVLVAAATVAAVGGVSFQGGRVYQERTTPPPAPKVIQLPPVAPAPAPVVEPEPEPEIAPPPPVVAPPQKPLAHAASPEAEVKLLQSALAAQSKGDSALALSLATQHAKRFAHGTLEQEREVIAIEALVALGRQDEAKKRADSFSKRFPTSTHLLKVESLVR